MATTRDQAYQQYQDIYRGYGRGDLLDAETDRQFEDEWKNASLDSGLMQGPQYQKSWSDLLPDLRARIANRVNDGPDSNAPATAAAAAPAAPPAAPQPQTPTQQWNAQPAAPAIPATSGPVAMTPAPAQPAIGTGDALIQQLMQRAMQSVTPSRTDPTIRAQADAYAANEERARRNYISDVAERAGPLANIEGERRMAAERLGQRTGTFEAELLGREQDARRQEAQNAYGMWGNLFQGDQGIGLQRELAALSAQQRGLDRNQSYDEFLRELALRQYDLGQTWDYRWLGLGI